MKSFSHAKTLFILSCIVISSTCFGQSELWGVASDGGDFNSGVIFKTDLDGTNQSVEYSFTKNVGITPLYMELCEASNGKMYGTTRMGGTASDGVLFEYDPATDTYTKKIDFVNNINGEHPEAGLYEASNGKLYGMTSSGGANGLGTFYEYDISTEILTVLRDFDGTGIGSIPYGTLVEAPNGRLYGLTSRGGANNLGILFEYNPATDIFVKKVTFNGTANGSRPYGSLTLASDGKLYGTTRLGGSNALGTIFDYVVGATSVTKRIDFNGAVRGSYPVGNLREAPNGLLYGLVPEGGASGDGVLYEFYPSTGTFVKEMDFSSATSGDFPSGSLLIASNGLLYGMTRTGGANNDGVLFSYDYSSSTFSKKLDFNTFVNGDRPSSTLIESGGLFYGMTYTGGSSNAGTLFEFDPGTDILTTMVDLETSPLGAEPYGSLMQHNNGNLYGLTRAGGDFADGVIFEYNPATNTFSVLHHFGDALDGQNPRGNIIEAANGKLYGLTDRGGANGNGVIFEYDLSTSTYTKLMDFTGTNGSRAKGSLLEASNGSLYGLTQEGGTNNEGVLFEYEIGTNTYTVHLNFDATVSGRWPYGSLIEASNGLLYGMTENGGVNYDGVLFQFNTSTDVYTKLMDFDTDHSPHGSLIEATNGNLYGLTLLGGANGAGAIFEYTIATDTYTNKYSFDGFPYTTGGNPYGSLRQSSNGHLYGMAYTGGTIGEGVIFEFDLSTDTYSVTHNFNYTDGSKPQYGHLIEASIPCIPTASTDVQTACDSYTWIDGNTYTSSNNTATHVLTNAAGCDSTVTLDLTINTSTTATDVQTACNSFTWIDGNTYTSSNNTATHVLTNAAGCDSTVTLDLTINNSTSGTDVQTACDSFTWIDGNTYTSSNNTATHVLTNAAGCDSTVTLDLTINNSTSGTDVQTACNSFTWIDGNTYTSSNNTATHVLTNAAGCDSTVTLDLTINNSTSGTEVQTACNSFTWIDGNTYTSSNNTATHVLTNAAGCDSTVTLDLTINNSTSGTDVQTACNSFTWIDGNTYTSSNNTATHLLTNAAGCDSTVTLDLTINNSTSGTDVQTACNSFTWIDGNTYTSSNNTATHLLTNAAGCDSTVTLDLTINNSTSGTDVQTACNSFTWIDGNTYTSSNNTATHVLTNAAGCDSTVTLDLTINNSTSGTDVQTACNSFTWIDGNTYTSSNNTATHVLTNAAGCDSTVTLDLTINTSTTATDVQTACNSFTWIDGNTYTSSNNTATHVLTNAAGCDSTVTLDLTISTIDVSTTNTSPTLSANLASSNYQWINCDNGNTIIPGETGQTFTATANGNYAVIIDNGNCSDTSACMNVNNVGLEDLNTLVINVYPNPSSGIFNISLPEGNYTLTILDLQGKELMLEETDESSIQIDLSSYEKSVYFLNVKGVNGSSIKKLIVH